MDRGLHKSHLATHKPRTRMNLQNFMKGEIVKRQQRDKLRSSFSLSHSSPPLIPSFLHSSICPTLIFPKFATKISCPILPPASSCSCFLNPHSSFASISYSLFLPSFSPSSSPPLSLSEHPPTHPPTPLQLRKIKKKENKIPIRSE